MGTSETSMAYVHDEIGRAIGLPSVLGGVPLDELGATGFGVAVCADVLREARVLELAGARVVIQGFGAVGASAARGLAERGASVIAVSDIGGALWNPDGLDVAALIAHKGDGPVAAFAGGTPVPRDDILGMDCEILVPAAQPDVVTAENAGKVSARVVLEGANIPVTREAEAELAGRGVLCIPDVVANAGGVICAAARVAPPRSPISRRRSATLPPSCSTASGPACSPPARPPSRWRGNGSARRRPCAAGSDRPATGRVIPG
jgi:glutamate dehydrogenase/leucine dehydrogenase